MDRTPPTSKPNRNARVDYEAFEASVERQVDAGSHGVVVSGTTGEPTSLTLAERRELFRRAAAIAQGRIAVVAATGSPHQGDTMELTVAAARAGVDAVLVVCPSFVRPSQEGLFRHFVAVAGVTDLPFLIYDIPGRAATGVHAATVERVAGRARNLVGLKSASPDLDLVTDLILRLGTDFGVFCGLESYSYPFLALGAAGLMSALGNLLPGAVADLCRLVDGNDHAGALALHRKLFRVNEAIFFETNPGPLKAMLAAVGLASAEMRPPLAPLEDAVRARVLAALDTVAALTGGGSDERDQHPR
jgi:4-hydroxy-tetrahydrodipicolinate synthase